MKKLMLTLVAIMVVTLQANALSKSRSREEARFLTDKMAYELDLTDEQLQDIYEINYDYFRSLGPVTGSYDAYYNRRYTDLSYVLYDWQWREFLLREYFLRPVYIYHGGWAFGIYNYYARTHFFFGIPHVYHTYRGAHYRKPNYYLGRRDMHHHAVAARPRPNLDHRRPQMTRPNAIHRPSGAPRPNGGNTPHNNSVKKDNKPGGQPNKGGNNIRPNNPTRNGNAGRNGNVNRTPNQNKGNTKPNGVTQGNGQKRNSTGSSTRSTTPNRNNSDATTRSSSPGRSSSVTRSSSSNIRSAGGQSTRSNNSGRGRR